MTEPHPLDAATALSGEPGTPTRIGRTSDRYWTFIGPFGGTSAATALRAVLEHPERQGDPTAATVNFCAPIARDEFEVRTRRVFQVVGRLPPFGTVSMTTYFHASADELAAHGTARLAACADARVFHRSYGDQTAEIYGAGGQLFATATQIAYFKL